MARPKKSAAIADTPETENVELNEVQEPATEVAVKEKQPAKADTKALPEFTRYDLVLLHVNRVQKTRNGKNFGQTKSVTVAKIERVGVPIHEIIAKSLNSNVDHQNPTDMGMPAIMQYLPIGYAKIGYEFFAEDLFHEDDDSKIIGISIDVTRRLN